MHKFEIIEEISIDLGISTAEVITLIINNPWIKTHPSDEDNFYNVIQVKEALDRQNQKEGIK